MAQASVENAINKLVESSATAGFIRNDDPLSIALRSKSPLNFEDLVRLNKSTSPANEISASTVSTSTAIFSSRKASTTTDPTSAGTCYPSYSPKGKGKTIPVSVSSLSATHGSESEAEIEKEAGQRTDLIGTGSWTSNDFVSKQTLKDTTRAKLRTYRRSACRYKKPTVIFHQKNTGSVFRSAINDGGDITMPSNRGEEYLYHSHGSSALHHVHPGTIEQGQCQFAVDASLLPTSLSRARCYVLAGLAILTVLTIFFAVLGAHYVGKNHMPRIKMIAFMTIVVTSFYTVIAVVVAKRALQEALLFGITMLVVGSALLTQLDDFVRSF